MKLAAAYMGIGLRSIIVLTADHLISTLGFWGLGRTAWATNIGGLMRSAGPLARRALLRRSASYSGQSAAIVGLEIAFWWRRIVMLWAPAAYDHEARCVVFRRLVSFFNIFCWPGSERRLITCFLFGAGLGGRADFPAGDASLYRTDFAPPFQPVGWHFNYGAGTNGNGWSV